MQINPKRNDKSNEKTVKLLGITNNNSVSLNLIRIKFTKQLARNSMPFQES